MLTINVLEEKCHLQVPVEDTSAMTVIHSIDELLKIFSRFIFFQPTSACLAQ